MNISPKELFLSEILQSPPTPIPEERLAYFRARLRRKFYNLVIRELAHQQRSHGRVTTRAAIARRLRKRPEQITRWLQAPRNWTLDTISDLLIAICAGEPAAEEIAYLSSAGSNAPPLDILTRVPSAEPLGIAESENRRTEVVSGGAITISQSSSSRQIGISVNVPALVAVESRAVRSYGRIVP